MTDLAPNFSSLLDESPTEIKAPPLVPVGTYLAIVGQYTIVGNPPNNLQPYMEVPFRIVAAGDDVSEDDLADIDVINKVLKRKYWLTEDAAGFIDQLHADAGVDLTKPISRRQRNDMIINSEVMIVVSHSQNKAGTRTFANVDRTLPAD